MNMYVYICLYMEMHSHYQVCICHAYNAYL